MGVPSFIEDEIYQAVINKQAIKRVRELHKPIKNNEVLAWWYDKYKPEDLFCVECMQNSDTEYPTNYPCKTIKALDGDK